MPNGFVFPKEIFFFGGLGILTLTLREKIFLPKEWIFLALLLLISTGVTYSNIRNFSQFEIQLFTIFGSAGFFHFAKSEFRFEEGLKNKFFKLLVILGVFETILGACEMLLVRTTRLQNLAPKMNFVGSLGNPEYLAFFIGVAFLIAFHERNLFKKAQIRPLFLGILLIGLLLTESRLTWLSLMITFLIYFIMTKQKITTFYFLLISMIGIISLTSFNKTLLGLHTIQGRLLIWKSAVKIAEKSSWMGVGLGQFRNYFFDSMKEIIATGNPTFINNSALAERAHSEFLDFFAEGGIPLLLFICLILGYFLLISFKNLSQNERKSESYVWIFTVATCFFSFPLHILPNLLTVNIFMVLLQPRRFSPNSEIKKTFQISRFHFLRFVCCFCFVALAAKISVASYCIWKATREIKNGDTMAAIKWTKNGLLWDADSYDLQLTLARLQYVTFDLKGAEYSANKVYSTIKTVDVFKLRGLVFLGLNKFEDAKDNYLELETAFPKMVTPKYYLGRIYSQLGQEKLAKVYFSKIKMLPATNEKASFDRDFSKVFLTR